MVPDAWCDACFEIPGDLILTSEHGVWLKCRRYFLHVLRTEGMAAFVDSWESLPLFETQQRLLDDVLERQRKVRLAHDPEGVARSLDVLGLRKMPDLRPSLSAVDLPVTLLVGELDYNYRLLAEEMSSELPDARVLTVAGVGHNVVLEAPEAVAEALRRANRSTPAVAS